MKDILGVCLCNTYKKGINDEKLKLHKKYFMEFLEVCFNSAQTYPLEDTIDIVTNFYVKYINLELEPEYYREFNALSMFRLKNVSDYYNARGIPSITKDQINNIDIIHNLNIIRNLHQIYSGLYFSRR